MKLRSLSAAITACVLALAMAGCAGEGATPSAQQPDPQATDASVAIHAGSHADAHASAHAGDHGALPVLADGQRWETDAPLRKAMASIREDVAKNLPAYHESRLQASDAEALAVFVEGNVNYMIANCELAPEPDAVLHVMIGQMMGAVAALRQAPASADGMPQLVSVVNDYQATFDHDGLQPLTHD
ncbi:MAG: hypothetical protein ACOH1P_07280 [Lysobacter sp.]